MVLEKYNNQNNYIPVVKKVFQRQLYMPKEGTIIYNHLEKSSYVVDKNKPYVLIGSKKEEWCVDKKTLLKSYELSEEEIDKFEVGMAIKTITTKPGVLQWAMKINLDEQIQIKTSWGEVLISNVGDGHGNGDWIICSDNGGAPDLNDRWILNGEIFEETIVMV